MAEDTGGTVARGPSMGTSRTFTQEEWADAAAMVMCEDAEGRGWLASKWWRGAWWIRGTMAARVASWNLLGEAGEVVRWLDPEMGGSVWLGLTPAGDCLRVVAVCGPGAKVHGAVLGWDALREAALDTARSEWLHWWEAAAKLKGRSVIPPEDLREGRIGVFELENGAGAVIGRIHEVQRGRVVSVRTTHAPESVVKVREGGRGWAWADRWRDAAAHLMAERRGEPFKSVDSAMWTVVHKRKRMVKEGILPPDPPKPAA